MKKQLGRVSRYTSMGVGIDVDTASDYIVELQERKGNLESAADEAGGAGGAELEPKKR